MNSTNNGTCTNSKRREIISRVLSSVGCSWNTNEANAFDEKYITPSLSQEEMPFLKIIHPLFSLTDDHHEEQNEDEEDNKESSLHHRILVQSKASKLMSRKRVYSQMNEEDNSEQAQQPRRKMLGNILDSFDQLVDARIRAYARILSNHVRVLSESNNLRGAQIAEYKLQTLLEVAANHLLFDSISTEFKIATTENNIEDDDSISESSTATKEEKSLSLPIELSVEIRSPRFFHEGLEANNRNDVASRPHGSHQGSLNFRAKGEVRGHRNFIGQDNNQSNDTDRCLTPGTDICGNSKDSNRAPSIYCHENVEIIIDSNALLSQMIEEASKVVSMAVELTNLTWTHNTQRQEDIMNDLMAENSRKVTNIIRDDDDDVSIAEKRAGRMTGKRPRDEDHPDNNNHESPKMLKQVSEHSFRFNDKELCDDEQIEGPLSASTMASTTSVATITNLHFLDENADRKTRYFVSDPSQGSSGCDSEHDRTEVCPHENFPPEDGKEESYNKISAERACNIVDFVLAGDIVPCPFSSNKKRRTK